MRERHLAFVDLEMTGLDPERHEVIEIGLILVRQHPQEDAVSETEVIGEYEWKTLPERIEDADPEALDVNGYTSERWKDAVPLSEAMTEFSKLVEDAIMVSHNVAVDAMFLEKAFYSVGIPNPMHYHRLDTMSMAYGLLYHDIRFKKFSMRELLLHFGIRNERAHAALSDTRAMYELYKNLSKISPQNKN